MTTGQLIECLVGKVAALEGQEIDGTAFSRFDLDDIKKRLKALGYEENGFETMYNGMTGKKLNRPIFIGPTYYQRLKHMVADKIHCLTMDHDVLTYAGWKSFDKITMDDKIATLKDGKIAYEKPIALLYYPDFEGKLYHIKTQEIDLQVTDNHRMWVLNDNSNEFHLIEADKIVNTTVRYQKDAEWDKPDCDNLDDDEWLWKLSKNQCQLLIDGIIENNTYVTTSIQSADDVMKLCLHAGWVGSITSNGDTFTVDISKENNKPEINNDTVQIEEMINAKCPIFCLQVPSEVFYVRRNGLGVWTGNSRARGPHTILTRRNGCLCMH